MAIVDCTVQADATGRELTQHGTYDFPVACYHDDLQEISIPWHWHEELELLIVHQGTSLVDTGSGPVELGEGCGCFINSGVLHTCLNARENQPCRYHSLVFAPSLVGAESTSVFWQKYILPLTGSGIGFQRLSPEIPWQREALQATESAWQAVLREEEDYELRVREMLSRVVLLLRKNLGAEQKTADAASRRSEERVKQMLAFIHSAYQGPMTLEEIAASASVSQSECLRCFKQVLHTTPVQYLKEYRLKQARGLLQGGGITVTEAALACGFTELSYFSRAFLKQFGLRPGQVLRPEKS